MHTLNNARWFFSRCHRFLAADKGGPVGGTSAAPVAATIQPPAFDAALMAAIPGATELLQGKTPAVAEAEEIAIGEPEEVGIGAETEPPNGEEEPATETGETQAEETDAEGEGEGEEKTEGEEEQPAEPTPEAIAEAAQKLQAAEQERDAIKSQLEAAQAELAQLKAKAPEPVLAPTPENPLAHVSDIATLQKHAQFNQSIKDWAMEHVGIGGALPPAIAAAITGRTVEQLTAEPFEVDAAGVGRLLRVAETALQQQIPQRVGYLQMEAKAQQYVETHYADVVKPESETGQLFHQFLHDFPQIKQLPTWRVALLDCARGAQIRIAEEKARAAKGAPEAKAAGPTPKQDGKKKDAPLAPAVPGKPSGAGARPAAAKPATRPKLKASMNAAELAEIL